MKTLAGGSLDSSKALEARSSDMQTTRTGETMRGGGRRLVRRRAFLVTVLGIIAAAAVAFVVFRREILDTMVEVLDIARGLGVVGPVLLAAIYVVACVFALPGSILSLGAGFAFGLLQGWLAVTAGSLLGVSACFVLGRTVLRNSVERMIAGNRKFRAIDDAVGKEGFKIVLLTRLSPAIPFNVLNYGLSLTKVTFRDYFLGSLIGMFPGTVMYVYLGTSLKSLTEVAAGEVEGGTAMNVLFYVGLAATVAVTLLVTRMAKRALRDAVEVPDPTTPAAGGGQEPIHG